MDNQKGLISLFLIMALTVLCVVMGLLFLLYKDALASKQAHLQDLAINQASLIEAVAQFDDMYSHNFPSGAIEATLSQIRDAHGKSIGFGQSGEFIIAHKIGGQGTLNFVVAHRFFLASAKMFKNNPNHISPVMAAALAGKQGVEQLKDYRGEWVMAAYAPVTKLHMGVVAKMDLREIRAPFIQALKLGLGMAVLLIGLGSLVYLRVGQRLLGRLERQHRRFASLVETMPAVTYSEDLLYQTPRYLSPQAAVLLGVEQVPDQGQEGWWNNHVVVEDIERLKHARELLLKQKRDMQIEYRMIRADGEQIWVRDVAKLVCDSKGLPIMLQGVVIDVSETRETHEKLSASEARFRQLYENAPIAYQSLDATGRIKSVNQAWLHKTGYELSQVVGHEIGSFLIPGQEDLLASRFSQFMKDGYVQGLEFDLQRKDGLPLTVSVDGQVSRDRDGHPLYTHCVLTDISEQQRQARALQESESRMRLILASTGEGIFGLDVRGNFTFVNPACLRMLGYDRAADLLGREMLGLVGCSQANGFSSQDKNCPIVDILETSLPNHGEGELFTRKDGSSFAVEFWSHPIQEGGMLVGAVVTFVDITQRLRHQAALKASELKYRTIFESVPTPLLILNTDGVVVDVNPAHQKIFGQYMQRSLLGTHVREHPGVTGTSLAERFLNVAMGEPMPLQQASYQTLQDGPGSHFNVRGVPFVTRRSDGRGDLQGALLIHENITDLKQTELKLRQAVEEADQASQAKGDFLAVMSHEIRTPMNLVVGMAELLLETEVDNEQKRYLEKLQQAGDTLLSLINNILDLTKLDEGQVQLLEEPYTPRVLMAEVASIISLAAEGKGLALTCETDSSVPQQVLGDPARLKQVLLNLLSNALKFTHEGQIGLTLSLVRQDGILQLCYQVSDSGMGIAEDHLEKVFERFRQADSSMTRRYGGSGLGLAISKQLVILMKGNIQVHSTEGQGTHFTIRLPLHEADELNVTEDHAHRVKPQEGLRLLLAEDSVDNRMLVRAYLRGSSHQLEMVTNGQEALAIVQEGGAFDLILMDVQMPVMDGYTATRAILAELVQHNRPLCPIVALTAHALDGDQARSLEAGCVAHLTKPIKKQALLDAITHYATS
ncbi:PAS domain S-box protein [Magnetococcus sp. PR-3]|uniref:PAS domain S-box protein n=1 Tax=Magnetococcus sp. PR-3 TaxID=3120355 RepID=UPI002FCDE879